MIKKNIVFYILSAFIAGILLLIYIEYNFTKNIYLLINGNEKLLGEFKVNNELKELNRDIVSVESKIRSAVTTKDSSHIEGLEVQILEIEADLNQLQKISDDDSSIKYIDELDRLVHEKLMFSNQAIGTLHKTGKVTAENILATQKDKRVTDSIILITQKIDSIRKKILSYTTLSMDAGGKKALRLSIVLTVLVLTSSAVLFWYIINTIQKQIRLIKQLNISEKKVRQAAQVKENFIANMSHEIRTPMNAILGFTNLLQRKNLDKESKEYVQTIQKSCENLLIIINEILDLSKIEAGMMRIESAPFSIRSLVHSVEMIFKSRADDKQLQLTSAIDESMPDTLEGDATRLTQILVNLVGNAIKFTQKGSISIHITNESQTGNTIETGITVNDTGIGVEQEKLKHIFERFQQAEDSVTRKYGGTGLGLSIVNDLVLLQHGSIKVQSEPGKGSSFQLVIPYEISTAQFSENVSSENNIVTAQTNFTDVNILTVEDNEINKNLIKHLFRNWQLKFDIVSSGKEAIEILQTKKYDLILMDIQMPEIDGYTAAREIRGTLKLDTPIIAMTAHAMAGEKEKCLGYGMNDYIPKPIKEDDLHKLIARFIQIKTPGIIQKKPSAKNETGIYKHINLQYMKEISRGNIEYEKTVTEQFIEAIPQDLRALEKAWQSNDIANLRLLAHNMKTTLSVMELNKVLEPYLNAFEYEDLKEEIFRQKFASVKSICNAALEEAEQFYKTL